MSLKGAAAAALAGAAVALAQPGVRAGLAGGYAGDDFWTLAGLTSPAVAAAVAGLAAGLTIAALWLAAALSDRIARLRAAWPARAAFDLGLKAAGFVALFAAAPQVFYEVYRRAIEGLPAQWVVAAPPSDRLYAALAFPPGGRMADHLVAAAVWGAAAAAIWAQAPAGAIRRAAALAACAVAPFALRAAFG
ncbi:MAG: hypothetical protein AAGF90_09320 [Pseudomonadota bacterium]